MTGDRHELLETLGQNPLFSGLPDEALRSVLMRSKKISQGRHRNGAGGD
jgi:hypothetical protein